jgi:UDP-N-acetyl-D-mannosaminuronic acid dehydrogenase
VQPPHPTIQPQTICVLGLGYIGLPTAAMFATHGIQVVGVDVNPHVVTSLQAGQVYLQEPGLTTLVHAALTTGNFRVQSEPDYADVFIIAVGTPLHYALASQYRPDLTQVISATESIIPYLRPNNLIVLESTVPPGTTNNILLPLLEKSGVLNDLRIAHCPERVLPGQILHELVTNDRLVGGVNPNSAQCAKSLYATFVRGDIHTTDATTAEFTKLIENTYRDVNIALANEFSLVAETIGIDIWQAIALANRHPRVNILQPGPGVGGHCIAVDPWFIVAAAPSVTSLIPTARTINDAMPHHIVHLIRQQLGEPSGQVVACLGLAYKADVNDTRQSPAIDVILQLQAEGYTVRAFDPYVQFDSRVSDLIADSLDAAIADATAVVVLTDHRQFRDLSPTDLGAPSRLILDTRNCLRETLLLPGGQYHES